MHKSEKAFVGVLSVAVIGAAAAAAVLLAPASDSDSSHTAASGQEHCYGAAKSGENDCMAADGSHTCAAMATRDYSGQEYKTVPAGTCVQMGGKTEPFSGTLALNAEGKLGPAE